MRAARFRRVLSRAGLAVAALSGLVGYGVTLDAGGADASPAPVCTAGTCTVTFSTPGVGQSWVVPAGVTSASFTLYGAEGGSGLQAGAAGDGGEVTGMLSLPAATTVTVDVGGKGSVGGPDAGGINGGGSGRFFGFGGGGGTDIVVGAMTLLVAGGGGGAGSDSIYCAADAAVGGAGGNADSAGGNGQSVTDQTQTLGGGGGGGAGSTSVTANGGAAGLVLGTPPSQDCGSQIEVHDDGSAGSPGALGQGGNGGPPLGIDPGDAGGGGGGYYGGGGGGSGAKNLSSIGGGGGGGGGSSFGAAGTDSHLVSDTANDGSINGGNGEVIITYRALVTTGTSVGSSPNPSLPGRTVTFTATVVGSDGGGSVAFSDNGVPIAGCSAVALVAAGPNFEARCATTSLAAGDVITATYSGDAADGGSSGTATQLFFLPVTATGSQVFGQSPMLAPVVTPTSGVVTSGTLTCTTVNGGTRITPGLAPGGSYTIDSSSCSGLSLGGPNAANYVISYVGGTFGVTMAPTMTTLVAAPTNPSVNQAVTFTATVAPSPATTGVAQPTGTVSFFVDSSPTPAAAVGLNGAGQAVFTTTVGSGSGSVVAVYGGDGNYLASTSTPATATVGCTTTITGTVNSLIVAPGTITCVIGGQVDGTVVVAPGGTLDLQNATVLGSIISVRAATLRLCGSHVGGSVAVFNSVGFVLIGDPTNGCGANTVTGSLIAIGNTGGLVVVGNLYHGALLATANRGAGPLPGESAPVVSGNVHF